MSSLNFVRGVLVHRPAENSVSHFFRIIYYHLSYTVNYNTFSFAVYLTCSDMYNVIFRDISFYVTN
jgi:hypothetical protein